MSLSPRAELLPQFGRRARGRVVVQKQELQLRQRRRQGAGGREGRSKVTNRANPRATSDPGPASRRRTMDSTFQATTKYTTIFHQYGTKKKSQLHCTDYYTGLTNLRRLTFQIEIYIRAIFFREKNKAR